MYIHRPLSCLASLDGQMNGCTVSQCSGCVGMAIDARAAGGAVSDKFKFSPSWLACICFEKHIGNEGIPQAGVMCRYNLISFPLQE